MALVETLRLVLQADTGAAVKGLENVGRTADRELSRTEDKTLKTAKTLQKFGTGALLVAGTVTAGLVKTAGAASDLEQAIGGTEAVFKDAAGTIEDAAKRAANGAGLSERAFREATTSIGGNLKRMGFDVDAAADKSIELAQVAADLAATYGGTTAEAVQALGAAFRGEADPAERFNLNLKVTAVNAKAVEMGLADSTSKVTENAKAMALLELITEQSADAQGQFAREADTTAGATQRATAALENAQAQLGGAMAPILADAANLVGGLSEKFISLNESTDGAVSRIATFGTIGIGAVGAVAAIAGKVLELNRSLRTVDGNLTTTGRNIGRFGKAMGAIGVAALAYEFIQWADSLKEVNVEIDKLASLAEDAQLDKFREDVANLLDDQAINDTAKRKREDFEDYVDGLLEGNLAVAESFIGLVESDEAFAQSLRDIGVEVDSLRPKFDAAVEGQVRQNDAQERGAEIVDQYAGATDDAADASVDYESAIDDVADAQEAANERWEEAVDALDDVSKKLRGTFDPLFGFLDAQRDVAEAQDKINAALKEHGRNSPEYQQAVQNAAESALGFESAALDVVAAVELGELKLDDAKASLKRWEDQGLLTKNQAEKLAGQLDAIVFHSSAIAGSNIEFTVAAHGLADAAANLDKVLYDLGQIDGRTATAKVFRDVVTRGISSGAIGELPALGFATGGVVPGPVGRPIAATVHGGEVVLPHDVVDSLRHGGGGQQVTNNITINTGAGTVRSARDLARELVAAQYLTGSN